MLHQTLIPLAPELNSLAPLPISQNNGTGLRILLGMTLFNIPKRIGTRIGYPLHLKVMRVDAAALDVVAPPV
ncbi:hypothetical protein BGLA2_1720078 [Burkholderia gladioli]|nr:hypothetical protein BGLA2_1720078 [Burkholderia gladioli]